MCLPPIPCHIIVFLISFFHHSTLRFNLYLHWVILVCKCISPGYYWKFPWTYVSFRGNSHCLALYFHLFYHIFLGGECLVSIFKNKLARHGSEKGTLVKVNLSVLMSLVAELSVIVSIVVLS